MSAAFYSDAVEKIRGELARGERAAVESVRRALERVPDPDHARGLPDADPHSESYVIEVLPEVTGGRGGLGGLPVRPGPGRGADPVADRGSVNEVPVSCLR